MLKSKKRPKLTGEALHHRNQVVFDFLMGRRNKWKVPKQVRVPIPMGVKKTMTGRSLGTFEVLSGENK